MARVGIGDIKFAIEWLRAYEIDDDDTNRGSCERMIAWLQAEATKREFDAVMRSQDKMIRETARTSGKPYGEVKARFRQILMEQRGIKEGEVDEA